MIAVLSNPAPVVNEHQIIHQLFDEGLDLFQIYKPHFSVEETQNFIQQISLQYHQQISLHSDHLKFHSLEELETCNEHYDYAFLSPVFDSISKEGYKGKFDLHELKISLAKRKERVIALGGIDEDKIALIKEAHFAGIALVGAVWQNERPIDKFKLIRKKWLAKEFAY
jgi:thiamine-phosphate pyrophosphorylase